jgi:hypothetical protein
MRTTGRRALAIGVGLMVLAGCGDRPGYDSAALERYLVASQAWRFTGANAVSQATCPSDRDLTEGMTLRCTLTVSGSKVPFRVRLTDVHAEKMKVTAAPDGVVIPGDKLREVVALALPETASKATVDCGGSAFIVARVGRTVDCTLVLGSQTKPFKVTVKDATGRVSIQS